MGANPISVRSKAPSTQTQSHCAKRSQIYQPPVNVMDLHLIKFFVLLKKPLRSNVDLKPSFAVRIKNQPNQA